MLKAHRPILAMAILLFGLNSAAQAALQVALGKVNTSVALSKLPSSTLTATQKFQLQTDPVITPDLSPPPAPIPLSDYVPVEGELDNTFDPSIFRLAVPADFPNIGNPSTDFSLGATVMGLTAYIVTSFQVDMNGGGYYSVNANGSVPTGDVNGGESGEVEKIHFMEDPSLSDLANTSNLDNYFFQVNLVPINATGFEPDFDPGVGTAFAGPGSFLTIQAVTPDPNNPSGQYETDYVSPDDNPFVASSSVPEPAAGAVIVLGAFGAMAIRPRKHRA